MQLYCNRGWFMWLLMEIECDCARLQVHILQIISMQLPSAHDIIPLQ